MRRRLFASVLMIGLCVLFALTLGPGVIATARQIAAANCVYLPFISQDGDSSATASSQAEGGYTDCPPMPTAESVPDPTLIPDPTAEPAPTAGLAPEPTLTLDPTAEPTLTPVIPALAGTVRLLPEHAQIMLGGPVPRYLVVLDASGSMSANFNGQCNNSGEVKQCANGPPGAPPVQVTGTGPSSYWTDLSERRIYVAKKALERLVRLTNMPGNVGYAPNLPADQMAVVWFNESASSANARDFSSDPAAIIDFITTANSTSSDNYRTNGGTNGATGLYRAALLLGAAPPTVEFNGQTYTYENHVILLTDGVSNQFLERNARNLWGGSSDIHTYPVESDCRNLGHLVIEDAACQTTEVGGMYNGWDRPITQMVVVSNEFFRSGIYGPTTVYVMVLSTIPNVGLQEGVSSSVDTFFATEAIVTNEDNTTNVDVIIDTIGARSQPQVTACQPFTATEWVSTIDGAHIPEGVPNDGEVRLMDTSTGAVFTTPITRDPVTGDLRYDFIDVVPGSYQLQASLFYKGDDGVTRMYTRIDDADTLVDTVGVSLSDEGQTFIPLSLRLGADICAL